VRELIFFSNNSNKTKEISNLFDKSFFKILSLKDFKKIKSPHETGNSFKKNAQIKSLFGLKKFNKTCFADDSGICIEALKNGPGIYSKEYLQNHKNYNLALKEIIKVTKKKNNFNAFFQTTICLSLDINKHLFFNGKVKGTISKRLLGKGGFGYDPIFIPIGHNLTFAQMKIEEKNLYSHRSIAIKKLKNYLLSLI